MLYGSTRRYNEETHTEIADLIEDRHSYVDTLIFWKNGKFGKSGKGFDQRRGRHNVEGMNRPPHPLLNY